MKKYLLIPLAIVLTIGLVFSSCAEPAPAPAPAPAPKPAPVPAPTPEPKPINLIFNAFLGETHPAVAVQLRWLDKIEAASNGRVKFERILGGALSTSRTGMKDLRKGVYDIGAIIAPHEPDVFPIASAALKFFYGAKDRETNVRIYKQVLDEFPEFAAEFEGTKPLLHMTAGPFVLVSRVPIRTLDDFKGLQIRTIGPFLKHTLETLEASPVSIPVGEVYVSLQKNIVDAVTKGEDAIKADSLAEVAGYTILLNIQEGGGQVMLISQDDFNSLPPDVQQFIDDSLDDMEADYLATYDAYVKEAEEWAKREHHHEWIELPPDELAKFYEILGEEATMAAAELDAKGLPGTKIYERIRQLIEETK